jgi:hypothetical protein
MELLGDMTYISYESQVSAYTSPISDIGFLPLFQH